MNFVNKFPSTSGVLLAMLFALIVFCFLLGVSIAGAIVFIWALNVLLKLQVAYGATEIIAVLIILMLLKR